MEAVEVCVKETGHRRDCNDAPLPDLPDHTEPNPARSHQARPSPTAPSQAGDEYSLSGDGCLLVLDETGDSRMMWRKDNPEEVAAAEARFNELKSKGYLAYKVDAKGGQGEVLHKFDPDAERVILHARMIGG